MLFFQIDIFLSLLFSLSLSFLTSLIFISFSSSFYVSIILNNHLPPHISTSLICISLNTQMLMTGLSAIKEGGQEIHRLLKEVNRKLKISPTHPDWRSYVEFMNDVVVRGLIRIVAESLETLASQVKEQERTYLRKFKM